jgi:MFS superfamily sulfate permease-like transporter
MMASKRGLAAFSAAWPALWVGSVSACATLALVLTLGLLAFAPLGAAAAGIGSAAGFVTVIVGAAVFACMGSVAVPAAGPGSATALILAALVASLVQDPALDAASASGLAAITSVCAASVMAMGALQVLLGLAGFGRLAQFVPQPVLAGFMNGVALMILVSQLPPLLGLPPLARLLDPSALAQAQPLTLAVGLATAAAVWGAARRWPRAPALLLGLATGCALQALVVLAWPGAPAAPAVGPLPQGAVLPDALAPLLGGNAFALLQRHAGQVALTAAVLALISALESLLAAIAIDQLTHRRHDSRRELLSLGAANLACGLCGGLPLVLSRTRAISLIDAQVTGRAAVLASVVAFAVMYATAGPLLALLPRTVLAGIMLTIAVALVDRWTHQLLRQWRAGDRSADLRTSLAVVAVVCGTTATLGFVAGVAVGLALSVVVFIRHMNHSLLRGRYTAAQQPSRRIHGPAQQALLQPLRPQATVLVLEGALFFGTAARLAAEADRLPPGTRHLLLDLQRVHTIDETGAVLLQQLSTRLAQRGVSLWLAGVMADNAHGRRLRAYGCFRDEPRPDWCSDIDHALEAVELALLAQAGVTAPQAAVPLARNALLRGLDEAQQALVLARLIPQRLAAGTLLFRQGDAGDRLYLLSEGSITIRSAAGPAMQRHVSFSPGGMLGEVALLDNGGRSADALADSDVQLHALTRSDLAALTEADPALGALLARNIALHLADRLRGASMAWHAGHPA